METPDWLPWVLMGPLGLTLAAMFVFCFGVLLKMAVEEIGWKVLWTIPFSIVLVWWFVMGCDMRAEQRKEGRTNAEQTTTDTTQGSETPE